MQAVESYIAIKQTKSTRKSSSGLEIPTALSDRFIVGEIVSVSDEGKGRGLAEGQEVLYDKHAGHEVKNIEGMDIKLVQIRDIALIL